MIKWRRGGQDDIKLGKGPLKRSELTLKVMRRKSLLVNSGMGVFQIEGIASVWAPWRDGWWVWESKKEEWPQVKWVEEAIYSVKENKQQQNTQQSWARTHRVSEATYRDLNFILSATKRCFQKRSDAICFGSSIYWRYLWLASCWWLLKWRRVDSFVFTFEIQSIRLGIGLERWACLTPTPLYKLNKQH